jgi:hypothetical protein
MTSQTRPLAHQLRKQLLTTPELYVESVGKPDMLTFNDVMQAPDGTGTVLRLVMGATARMPFRALTYVDALFRIAQVVPCQQIQVVHANDTGHKINGIDRTRARDEATALAEATRDLLHAGYGQLAGKVLHAEDGPVDFASYADNMHTALRQHKDVASKLHINGRDHRGDTLLYAAAHVAIHDNDMVALEELLPGAPSQVLAERIVSVGSQSERPFYLARMAVRQVYNAGLVDTAQIFTKHVSAPYFQRNHEQTLHDAQLHGVSLGLGGDAATQRDIAHYVSLHGGSV